MSDPLRLLAPAKINLYLEVIGRRPDGYHELRMLMAPVSLVDELTLERHAEPGRIEVESAGDAQAESGERNLCHKAARYYFDRAGVSGGVRIRLAKRIPVGAGLGGGSSDAAATILGLEALFCAPLSPEARVEAAFRVGADVPFFFARSAAWVSGVGEQVEPVRAFPTLWLVVVHPGVFLSTGAVYGHFSKVLTSGERLRTMSPLDFPGILAGLRNDLQPAARSLEPAVGEVLSALDAVGAAGSLVSGSGSAGFGLFADEAAARGAAAALKRLSQATRWRVEVARTLPPGSFPFVSSTSDWGVDKR